MRILRWLSFTCLTLFLLTLSRPCEGLTRLQQTNIALIQQAVADDAVLQLILARIAFYESSWTHEQWGDLDLPIPVYGLFQFQRRTFKKLCREAGYRGLNWMNKHHQILVARWAIEHGYGSYWGRSYKLAIRDAERALNGV